MRRSIGWFLLLGALALRPAVAAAQDNPFSSCGPDDVVRFQGSTPELIPERPGARRLTLTGSVVIPCKDMTLYADTVIYEDDTEIVQAIGHVTLQQADLLIYADRAEINRLTRLGTFYDARGSARLANQPTEKSLFGTLEPDVLFFGNEISKTGPKTYRIHDGGFTTCVQPTPRWEMSTSDGTITLDKHALLRNVVLRVKDVPLLFLPAIYYPINKEDRSTGFLLPTYGSSTLRGTSLSNAFFLALGRSQDATFYHDWFSKTGQGIGTEYRYVQSRASRGNVRFYTLRERALFGPDGQTVATPAHTSYRVDGDVNQALPHRFRIVGRANFFTDASTQQAYQNISDFSQRERYFSGTRQRQHRPPPALGRGRRTGRLLRALTGPAQRPCAVGLPDAR